MNNTSKKQIEPPTKNDNNDDEDDDERISSSSSSSCSNKDATPIKLNFGVGGGFRRRGMELSDTNTTNTTTTASQTSQHTKKKHHHRSSFFSDINKGLKLMLYIMCIYCTITTLRKMNNNRNSQLIIISPPSPSQPQPPSDHHRNGTIYIVQYNNKSSSLSSSPPVVNNTVSVQEMMKKMPLLPEEQKQPQQLQLQKPSFKIRDDTTQPCVKSDYISSQIDMIETAYYSHNIRIFPRNGYLLGAIRHGGFLPNENIDADLAVMYEDIIIDKYYDINKPLFKLESNKTSIVYKFKPILDYKRWFNFDGRNPITNEKYKFIVIRVYYGGGTKVDVDCILPYYDNTTTTTTSTGGVVERKKQMYPFYAGPRNNMNGNLKENERYRKEGGTVRVLGTGNENKSLLEDVGKVNIAVVFEPQWFDELVPVPFYDQQILVPIGYHNILKGYYGRNYMTVENRKDWEAIPVSQEDNERYMKNGPLAMCSF